MAPEIEPVSELAPDLQERVNAWEARTTLRAAELIRRMLVADPPPAPCELATDLETWVEAAQECGVEMLRQQGRRRLRLL